MPPHITGGGGPVPTGWEPPGSLNRSVTRELVVMPTLDTRSTFTTSHERRVYHSGEGAGPQKFVQMTTQGGGNTAANIDATASKIRLSRRALSRNRGRLEVR
jgi:hypothetical protein